MFPLFLDVWDFHLREERRGFTSVILFVGVKQDEEQTQYCLCFCPLRKISFLLHELAPRTWFSFMYQEIIGLKVMDTQLGKYDSGCFK